MHPRRLGKQKDMKVELRNKQGKRAHTTNKNPPKVTLWHKKKRGKKNIRTMFRGKKNGRVWVAPRTGCATSSYFLFDAPATGRRATPQRSLISGSNYFFFVAGAPGGGMAQVSRPSCQRVGWNNTPGKQGPKEAIHMDSRYGICVVLLQVHQRG